MSARAWHRRQPTCIGNRGRSPACLATSTGKFAVKNRWFFYKEKMPMRWLERFIVIAAAIGVSLAGGAVVRAASFYNVGGGVFGALSHNGQYLVSWQSNGDVYRWTA